MRLMRLPGPTGDRDRTQRSSPRTQPSVRTRLLDLLDRSGSPRDAHQGQVIKYIGSKRLLVPWLSDVIGAFEPKTAQDLFCGTSRVAVAMRAAGIVVHANDNAHFASALAHHYVSGLRSDRRLVARWLARLRRVPPRPGYFTETFCVASRFLTPQNGELVDAIRDEIGQAPEQIRPTLLTSLLEAADRVDSTVGLQMAYLKQWASRALRPLELRLPDLPDGPPGLATRLDAAEAAEIGAPDLVYLDPPYNSHRYLGNYHVWETLVRWDRPAHYGVACKRLDTKDAHSPYNSAREAGAAFRGLVDRITAPTIVVSYSDDGHMSPAEIAQILSGSRGLMVLEVPYGRHVCADIGRYTSRGDKSDRPHRTQNCERLFVASTRLDRRAVLAASRPHGAKEIE